MLCGFTHLDFLFTIFGKDINWGDIIYYDVEGYSGRKYLKGWHKIERTKYNSLVIDGKPILQIWLKNSGRNKNDRHNYETWGDIDHRDVSFHLRRFLWRLGIFMCIIVMLIGYMHFYC